MFFALGLCFGSFGNVVALRMPKEESIVLPRSHCPHCKHSLGVLDLIPVFSFLFLRGRCRYCQGKISWQYPLVELLCGVVFAALFIHLGLSVTFFESLLFAWMGIVASVIDFHHRILPDKFTLTGIALGLVGSLINPHREFQDALLGVLGGGGFLWLVAYIYSAIKNEEGMGGGDIKLIAWIGAVMGWQATIFSILVSSILGSVVGLTIALIQRSGLKTAIPFGPFLVAAALIYLFFGTEVMDWYMQFFFPFRQRF